MFICIILLISVLFPTFGPPIMATLSNFLTVFSCGRTLASVTDIEHCRLTCPEDHVEQRVTTVNCLNENICFNRW